MRTLRKIIFVNSANIRYAEVLLDGNVHFIGTQGVGKSTLLRAILFFYNADKLHLGIPREMKTFDEFYLPHANSYVIYEVEHEHGPFSIIVYRSTGRACYRFVDAAFDKNWIISEHGEVTSDVSSIRSRLNGVLMSKKVDRYEQYRDIIYGNETNKELARFRLMENRNYHNIYRSIQNVFLNSRLDANFIKDIIIRSMNEDEYSINLGYYRGQVSNFEQEYRDINLWYKANSKGEVRVRKQADSVMTHYHTLLYQKSQIEELCGKLNYAVRTSKEKLPLLRSAIDELTEKRDREKRLLSELQGKHDAEKNKLVGEIAVLKDQLDKAKAKRDYYAAQHIDNVMERCEKEAALQTDLKAYSQRLNDLTSKFKDVTSKYEKLIDGVSLQLMVAEQTQKQKENELRAACTADKERIMQAKFKKLGEIDALHEEKIANYENRLDAQKAEKSECEKAIFELKFFAPYKAQLEDLKEQKRTLQSEKEKKETEIGRVEAVTEKLRIEYEKQEAEIVASYDDCVRTEQMKCAEIEAKIAELNDLLSRTSGSLYEWLNDNVSGWERNIGKVVDEQRVLYRTGLHPRLAKGSDGSLFGVDLDLSDLPMCVRKPDELAAQRTELEQELGELRKAVGKLTAKKDSDIETLKKQFVNKLKGLNEQCALLKVEVSTIPGKLKAMAVSIREYEDKTVQEKDEMQRQLNSRLSAIVSSTNEMQNELAKIKADKNKQRLSASKTFDNERKQKEDDLASDIAAIEKTIAKQRIDAEAEVSALKHQEIEELRGNGADTNAVKICEQQIKTVEDELAFIDAHRQLVYGYQKDKEELFDHEAEIKANRATLVEKLGQMQARYDLRRQEHQKQIDSFDQGLAQRNKELQDIQRGLKSAEDFSANDNLCPPCLHDVQEVASLITPQEAVAELTGLIVNRQQEQDSFRESINQFKANFSAKNTFNFRLELLDLDDYMEFASSLNDFLQNNLIEQYRKRTSERYTEILSRVSKEIGDLTRHESDIEKIISDINKDFRVKNFVGVIKLISLQKVATSDSMTQLMKRIKEFNDDNQFAMGELSLFSTGDRDAVNDKAIGYLLDLMKALNESGNRQLLTLSDLFHLQFRVIENDNDTGWVDKLSHVGSEGTDILVKAMVNIMLISVFKTKVSKKFGDFKLHCMMDEIGKLHPQNVKGILDFANARNIQLINSSPTTYNVSDYRYTYLLSKDGTKTVVKTLIVKK